MPKKQIPESWVESKVGDVIKLDNGFAFKSDEFSNSGIPVVRISNIQEGYVDLSDAKFIKEANSYERFTINKNDLLVAMSGATTGKMGVYTLDKKSYLNQRVGNLRVIVENSVDLNYRNYFFKKSSKDILDQAYGGAQPNISGKMIEELDFPLPPVSEQKRIVAKIESIQAKIKIIEDNVTKADELIEKYRQSLLQKAFRGELIPQNPNDESTSTLLERINVDRNNANEKKKKKTEFSPIKQDEVPFEIPKSWKWVRLAEIVDQIQYGYTASAQENGTHKFLRITDLTKDGINWSEVPFCSPSKADAKDLELLKGDILFARTGGTVGKSHLIDSVPTATVFASYLIKVRPISLIVNPTFLSLFFSSPLYWKFVTKSQRGAAQPNINGTVLASLEVPLPPRSEQDTIIANIETSLAQLVAIKNTVLNLSERASQCFSSVLLSAFSGDLVPQLASEGTGHELLAEIRSQIVNETDKSPALKNMPKKRKSK